MNGKLATINTILMFIGITIGTALGGWDIWLQIFVAILIADYITGVMVAICDKKVSSKVGFKGLFKKMVVIAMIWLACMADKAADTHLFRYAALCWYGSNEGISFLENIGNLGVPYPKWLKTRLVQLRKSGEVDPLGK